MRIDASDHTAINALGYETAVCLDIMPSPFWPFLLTRVEWHVEQFGQSGVVGEAQVVLQTPVDEALSRVVMGGSPMSDVAVDGVL